MSTQQFIVAALATIVSLIGVRLVLKTTHPTAGVILIVCAFVIAFVVGGLIVGLAMLGVFVAYSWVTIDLERKP